VAFDTQRKGHLGHEAAGNEWDFRCWQGTKITVESNCVSKHSNLHRVVLLNDDKICCSFNLCVFLLSHPGQNIIYHIEYNRVRNNNFLYLISSGSKNTRSSILGAFIFSTSDCWPDRPGPGVRVEGTDWQ
jgi:hypothetical protein